MLTTFALKHIFTIQRIFLFVFCFILPFQIYSQAGKIDPSFNPTDYGFGKGDGANNKIYSLARQKDGKILIGGIFTEYNGASTKGIARLKVNGTLDSSFRIKINADNIRSILIQEDGKILVAGYFDLSKSTYLTRFYPDGSIDTTFSIGTGPNSMVSFMKFDSQKRIVLAGSFSSFDGKPAIHMVRLLPNGDIDNSFQCKLEKSTYGPNAFDIAANGNIVVVGFLLVKGEYTNIVKLFTDGSIGAEIGGMMFETVYAVAIQPDGKIIVGGRFQKYFGDFIARFDADGYIDPSFKAFKALNDYVFTIKLLSSGKMYIGGGFSSYKGKDQGALTLLNSDGTLDSTYNPPIVRYNVNAIQLAPDSSIYIGGDFNIVASVEKNYVAHIFAKGQVDSMFNKGTGAIGWVHKIMELTDGKLLVSGGFSLFQGRKAEGLIRLHSDGNIDTTFKTNVKSTISTFAPLSDGKILVSIHPLSAFKPVFVRLNPNGSIDSVYESIIQDISIFEAATEIIPQKENKLLVFGSDITYKLRNRSVIRISQNGILDKNFIEKVVFSNISLIDQQLDGKLICVETAGNISNVIRLSNEGLQDTTFNITGKTDNKINQIKVLQDGKVLLVGDFTQFRGKSLNRIARLHSNGTLDTTLQTGTGFNGSIAKFVVQKDGRIILFGDFTTYNNRPANQLVRILANGQIDTLFQAGAGTGISENKPFLCAILDKNEKLLVGGKFTSIDGIGKNRIGRIFTDCEANINVTKQGSIVQATPAFYSDYQWFDCKTNQAVLNENKPTFIPQNTGSYYVKAKNGTCLTSSNCVQIIITSLETEPENTQISVYPNPAQGLIHINLLTASEIVLLNGLGEKVYNQYLSSGSHSILLPTDWKGIYIIKSINKEKQMIGKFIIY